VQHTSSCGEFIYPQPACPAVVATKHLAQYESPGCPCCCSAALLIFSSFSPTGPESGQSGREQGARSKERGGRQWSSGQWSNEHRRLHAKYSSRHANRGSVALCSYVALPIVSTEPSLSVPNRPSWSPPIFSGYYFESKRKYSVLCCTVRSTYQSRPPCLLHNESRQEKMQQEIDDLDLLDGSVRSCPNFWGGLLGTGIARATVTGHFGHAPEGADTADAT
jgi:hypothetical protein